MSMLQNQVACKNTDYSKFGAILRLLLKVSNSDLIFYTVENEEICMIGNKNNQMLTIFQEVSFGWGTW